MQHGKANLSSGGNGRFIGPWMTDIDDTIIPSGIMPDSEWIGWLIDKLRCLKKHRIGWVPMTGVAIDKLGPRILDRLPADICSNIIYYGGDGSQKYYFDKATQKWKEDTQYRRVLSDAQTLAILGDAGFNRAFVSGPAEVERRRREARTILHEGGFNSTEGLLGEMANILQKHGFGEHKAETYFRGGSISWMMLGDVSVEPYQRKEAINTRAELLEYGKSRLRDEVYLRRFGSDEVHIPFHGSRGIKFVLKNNDKERGTRDLIKAESLTANSIIFTGNELFEGGNDHVITRVEGVSLISVGTKVEENSLIIRGGTGIEAYKTWMEHICMALEAGVSWPDVIEDIHTGKFSYSE